MTKTKIMTMANGVRVVVYDSIHQITTYVLEEQDDWFEHELSFVRKFLKPGDTVLDIGANLGMYALSIASVVGEQGRVIAFEPTNATAELLRESAAINGFSQLEVDPRGMASRSGTARFRLHSEPEYNQILDQDTASDEGDIETITLTSLDEWSAEQKQPTPIRLIKIDAEGQESNIIKGSKQLLQEQSPMILYEVKHRNQINLELVNIFAEIGYQSYRLLPGPLLLERFDPNNVDPFLLNLFCCKQDAALKPENQAFISCQSLSEKPLITTEKQRDLSSILGLPYAKEQKETWLQYIAQNPENAACRALALYALSTDESEPASRRVEALRQSVERLRDLCIDINSPIHLASLARAAYDYGQRGLACEALSSLIGALPFMGDEDFNQPFLVPCAHFDTIKPNNSLRDWLLTASVEANLIYSSFSTFFSGPDQSDFMQNWLNLGVDSDLLRKRLQLINQRLPT